MDSRLFYSFGVFAMILIIGCTSEKEGVVNYFDQTPPSTTPEVFAPGVISMKNEFEFGSVISKDGREFYYGVDVNGKAEIRQSKFENGKWSKPAAFLSHTQYGFNDPFLSPSQNELYFISDRPIAGEGPRKEDQDIYYIKRTGDAWSDPIRAEGAINTDKNEYFVSIAENGRLYFASNVAADSTRPHNFDIYSSIPEEGKYQKAFKLGGAVNSDAYEADVFVAPDESYLIFSSVRRDGFGRGDLYISFKNDDGSSTKAVNLGMKINTDGHELCPFVTPDGKYLFYTSNEDIYWVNADILTTFK